MYGVEPLTVSPDERLGISSTVRTDLLPVNGLRHSPGPDTCGWYIWAGEELPDSPDFFQPLHVEHLEEWCPAALPFLSLPPGWRFLVAGDYVDVWFDESVRLVTG